MKTLALLTATLATLAAISAGAAGRLADVTVTDRTLGRTLPIYWQGGQAYVAGTPGHEYAVSVRSRDAGDLLAVASVDGVNVISGDTAHPSQSGYVIEAGGTLAIKGWRKSMGEIASFYFTSLGDSYAARTDRPDNVGVIGVALFQRAAALPPPAAQAMPRDDGAPMGDVDSRRERAKSTVATPARPPAPSANMAAPAPGEPLGTGHGRREASRIHYVDFVRATSEPVETIAIRYDSYRNLVAMGVIPTYGRRDPSPFPGPFAPDPR